MFDLLPSFGLILLLLIIGYVLLAIAGHHLSLVMIFPRPPVQYELGPDYLTLTAPDGTKLAARYWPLEGAKYTMLYLHGNYEDLGSIGEYIPGFTNAGYSVFAFDYRRYGLSEGIPTEANVCADAQLAYDYLRTTLGVPADRIVIYGYSLGGGPAVELALNQQVAGLVLQGAFTSAYRVRTIVPLFPGDKFRNISKVARLRCPVLIIHGTADRTVPFRHGPGLYAAITAPKHKFYVEGGPHAGLADFAGPGFADAVKKFTASLP